MSNERRMVTAEVGETMLSRQRPSQVDTDKEQLRRRLEEVLGATFEEFDPSSSRGLFGVVPMPITPIIEQKTQLFAATPHQISGKRSHPHYQHHQDQDKACDGLLSAKMKSDALVTDDPRASPKLKLKLSKEERERKTHESSEAEKPSKRMKLDDSSSNRFKKGHGKTEEKHLKMEEPTCSKLIIDHSKITLAQRSSIISLLNKLAELPSLLSPLRPSSSPSPPSTFATVKFVKAEDKESSLSFQNSLNPPKHKSEKAHLKSKEVEMKKAKHIDENENDAAMTVGSNTNGKHCYLALDKLSKSQQQHLLKRWEEMQKNLKNGSLPLKDRSGSSNVMPKDEPMMELDELKVSPPVLTSPGSMTEPCDFPSPLPHQNHSAPNIDVHSVWNVGDVPVKNEPPVVSYFTDVKPLAEVPPFFGSRTTPGKTPVRGSTAITEKHESDKTFQVKSVFLETSRPETKASIELFDYQKPSVEHYHNEAYRAKRRASEETDRLRQTLLLFEALVHYIAGAMYSEKGDPQYENISNAVNFLNHFFDDYKKKSRGDVNGPFGYFRARVKALERFVSSCLAFRLYNIRNEQAYENYVKLARFEKDNAKMLGGGSSSRGLGCGGTGSVNSGGTTTCSNMTPSPASSTPGGTQDSSTVSVPHNIYLVQSLQIRTLTHLMWSHRLWEEGKTLVDTPENKEFFHGLTELCGGGIDKESSLLELAEYLLTAIKWLQREYGVRMQQLVQR